MSGTRRRDACIRGEGGPSAELVGVIRRSSGGETRRRCDGSGESVIVAADGAYLGDIDFSFTGILSATDVSSTGCDGAGATTRVTGDDEGASGKRPATLRARDGGGRDHEPHGTTVFLQCPDARVAPPHPAPATCRFALRPREGLGGPAGETRAGGGEGGARGWGGGLGVLDLPPRPSPTADVGVPRAAASPAWIRPLHASEFAQLSAERADPSRLREEDIAAENRCHPALAGSFTFAYAASSRP